MPHLDSKIKITEMPRLHNTMKNQLKNKDEKCKISFINITIIKLDNQGNSKLKNVKSLSHEFSNNNKMFLPFKMWTLTLMPIISLNLKKKKYMKNRR